jgi:hypothetical protein
VSAGPHAILWPAFALVALTFLVWLQMFFARVGEMRRLRIHPQSVATSPQAAQRFVDTRAADNFRNVFELPVLFYLAIVVLRVVHSAIHCGCNRVMHRFYADLAGGLALWTLWGALAVSLQARA